MRHDAGNEQGQTMAEYSLVLTLITAGIFTALVFFSDQVRAGIMRAVDLMS